MPKSLILAASRLADVIERENIALAAMDLHLAATLLPEKTAAIARLAAAGEVPGGSEHPVLISMARRLDGLVLENRLLLERAIAAQQSVIGIVARASVAAAEDSVYGATTRAPRRTGPMAFSTRA